MGALCLAGDAFIPSKFTKCGGLSVLNQLLLIRKRDPYHQHCLQLRSHIRGCVIRLMFPIPASYKQVSALRELINR